MKLLEFMGTLVSDLDIGNDFWGRCLTFGASGTYGAKLVKGEEIASERDPSPELGTPRNDERGSGRGDCFGPRSLAYASEQVPQSPKGKSQIPSTKS